MACEDLRATLMGFQNQYAALEQEVAETPPPDRAAAQKAAQPQLNKLNAEIAAASIALSDCLAGLAPPPPQRVPGAQPKDILAIRYQNPNFGGDGTGSDWAKPIGGHTFPLPEGLEWKQAMDTTSEYDTTPVGASGWVAYPADLATDDFMFTHPFGNDWEFLCVLDQAYLNLVSAGNINLAPNVLGKTLSDVADDLTALGVPSEPDIRTAIQLGLLGVESDSGCVPGTFQVEFAQGDRVAVFGRWIVDCGHSDFHTEIHPPLLLASASVYKQGAGPGLPFGAQYTRALFTSRPYLVGQTFCTSTDPGQLYNDSGQDDGHFLGHMGNEATKAASFNPFDTSLHYEAHPKIKQFPFQGPHLFSTIVRTTEAKPPNANLVVSFHFTVRTPCSVEVVRNDDSSVTVYVAMNSAGYTPPPLPGRQDVNYSLSDIDHELGFLETAGASLGAILFGTEWDDVLDPAHLASAPKAALVLLRGVTSDKYAQLPVIDFRNLGLPNAVNKAPATAIPAGQGITVGNTQPYPVAGWIEVQWSRFAGVLQVVGLGIDGQLWHTIRNPDGTWTPSFGRIEGVSSGGPPAFTHVSCGNFDGLALQVVGLGDDGQLWHTIRNPGGTWTPSFGLIEGVSSGGPAKFVDVACGSSDGFALQVVGLGDDGRLWHTIRNPDGTWTPSFGIIEGESSGGPASFKSVGCAGTESPSPGLQVVGVGVDGQLWHTIRNDDGTWTPSFGLIEGVSSGGPANFIDVACGSDGFALQVVGVGVDGQLWHTIRNDDGTWTPTFGLIEGVSSGGPASFESVGCAGRLVAGALQVVGLGVDGQLWHTIRNDDGTWTPSFGLIEGVSSGGPASFKFAACVATSIPGNG